METRINKLFENARQANPLLTLADVGGLLDGAKGRMRNPKNKFFTLKTISIMITLISAIITTIIISTSENTTPAIPTANNETVVLLPENEGDTTRTKPGPVQGKAIGHETGDSRNPDKPHTTDVQHPDADKNSVTVINMRGINLLQLNRDALFNLGILAGKQGICVPTGEKTGDMTHFTYTGLGTITGIYKSLINELKLDKGALDKLKQKSAKGIPYPLLITDDLGKAWRAYQGIEDVDVNNPDAFIMKIQAKINTLVPILVISGDGYTLEDSLKNNWRPDVILWYEPTPEFLALLPSATGDEIKTEKETIIARAVPLEETDKGDNNGKTEPANGEKSNEKLTTSCKYFESCKSDNKTINNLLVYPNPTEGKFTVSVDLAGSREVSLTVTDISGKTVVQLHKAISQEAGKASYDCDISNLSPGMYLLVVETAIGERATQRIIKKQ